MVNLKNIKIILGIAYILAISIFLWFFFSYFSIEDFTSYKLIRENIDTLTKLKQSNIFVSSILFFLFTIIWIFLLGFALPIFLAGGFIFGQWIGTILVVFSLSFASTLFYIFANFFLKDIIKQKFSSRYDYLIAKFEKNELLYFLIYRFIGGIPFVISNLIPVLFNIKSRNFFFGTLIGMTPQLFIGTSLGAGFEKVIKNNTEAPQFFELIFLPEIYLPIIGFLILVLLGFILKKFIIN